MTVHLELDWGLLGTFSGLGVLGTFVGSYFASRLPQRTLRRLFGALLVMMAGYILWRSLVVEG